MKMAEVRMKVVSERRRENQRGMAIFFYATMLIFVVGCVGLAVDVGTIYMIRARLVAAVDAAALAAGRSVNLQNTVQAATTAATNTANQFFAANFPNGYFNSIGTPTVTPTFTQVTDSNGVPTGVLNISVTASVTAPTYFMNIFNVHSLTVNDTGTASRRGIVMVLVLDKSVSMITTPDPVSGLTACQAMVQAAGNFVNLFSPFDYIGVLPFDVSAYTTNDGNTGGAAPAQGQQALLGTLISNINCGSSTNTISALHYAYQWIKNVNQPLALNSIVLFTDGSPNGVTANFPARTVADNRYGSAINAPDGSGAQGAGWTNPPTQSGTSTPPGLSNSCNSNVGVQDANSVWSNEICVNMPATMCTVSTDTIFGTITQGAAQNSYGGGTSGPSSPSDVVSYSIPSSCKATSNGVTALPGGNMRQFIAYIPDTDVYGNSLHGVTATGSSPYGTVSNGLVTRDYWLFQANSETSPDGTVNPATKNVGDLWSNHTNIGMVSNFFPSGTPYQNKFRPDEPNAIVAAGMNGTMAQAYTIRSDTTYNPIINVIYLTGNSTDSVDREFLPIVANAQWIIPLPYDSQYTSTPGSSGPAHLYQNPAYQANQQVGTYLVTADRNQLTNLFAQLASETLRLSY
jgi:Flp pilus assembly protein TadG